MSTTPKLDLLKQYSFTNTQKQREDSFYQYLYQNYLDPAIYSELLDFTQKELPDNTKKYKLYFTENTSYMKSTLWNSRNNKNLTVTTKMEDADFIITPKYQLEVKLKDSGNISMSYINNELYLTAVHNSYLRNSGYYDLKTINKENLTNLLTKVEEIKVEDIKYNPTILQETDFNIVFYPYLELNLIDSEVVDTIRILFNSQTKDIKQIASIIETSDFVKSNSKNMLNLLLTVTQGISNYNNYGSTPIRKLIHLFSNITIGYSFSCKIYKSDLAAYDHKSLTREFLWSMFSSCKYWSSLSSYLVTYQTPAGLLKPDFKLETELEKIRQVITSSGLNLTTADVIALMGNLEDRFLRTKKEEVLEEESVTFVSE